MDDLDRTVIKNKRNNKIRRDSTKKQEGRRDKLHRKTRMEAYKRPRGKVVFHDRDD